MKNNNDDKKSILKQALTDYDAIVEAANINAQKKLAEEFPEKFNNLIKEELKNKKNSVNESEKDDEKTELNDDKEMKKNNKETKKDITDKEKEVLDNEVVDKKDNEETKNVEEDVKINKTIGDGKPYGKNVSKNTSKTKNGREKSFMPSTDSETPNKAKNRSGEKGDAYSEKINKPESGEPIVNKKQKKDINEDFDITELDVNSAGTALENADADDEVFTIDDIENEINELTDNESTFVEPNSVNTQPSNSNDGGDAYNKMVDLRNTIDEMIKNLGVDEQKRNSGAQNFNARNKMGSDGGHAGMTTDLIDEISDDEEIYKAERGSKGKFQDVDKLNVDNEEIYKAKRGSKGKFQDVDKLTAEQKRRGGKQSIPGRENGGPTQAMIDEENPISDEDIENILDNDVDETQDHTITHSNARQTGAQNNTNYGKENRLRYAVREDEKKMKALIEENKKITKKLNESNKYKKSVSSLIEEYKTALGKYRSQLKEMAIFNSNLAHVNNLLVNEELALTQNDKHKIINEFKKIQTITESQNKYNELIGELKSTKKPIRENFENKVNASIQPSSKKMDEVKENTIYENNEHLKKMKRLIEYVDNRGKKKIIK